METPSLYIPELHQFKMKGKNIVFDVMTSRIFAVDDLAYEILAHAHESTIDNIFSILTPNYSRDEITTTMNELKQARLLQESPFDFQPIKVEGDSELPLRAMDLILSQDCNLRCRYCFADTGAYKGERSLMNTDVAKSAIDFMIQRSGNLKDLFVVFFGGEPTVNIPVMKETIEYVEAKVPSTGKNIHFTISTNGTLLTEELIQYLHSKKVAVQISIDGNEETQDRNRPYQGNKGSYSDVKENTSNYIRITGHSIHARATVTSWDADNFVTNVNHLLSMGFTTVHEEPAAGVKGKIFINNESDIQRLIEQYEKMCDIMLEKIKKNEYLGFDNITKGLHHCHNNKRKLWFCSTGRGYLCVGADGKLYPCHRFIGNNKYLLGNVVTKTYDPYWEKFLMTEAIVTARKSCSHCWVRFLCGGDCLAHSEEKYGDILTPDPLRCVLAKRIAELTILIYAHITKDQKDDIARIYGFGKKQSKSAVQQEQG
ncbi:MAG: radical SAM protein [Bacteroidota bacterium]|jgi:uncharacterized protein